MNEKLAKVRERYEAAYAARAEIGPRSPKTHDEVYQKEEATNNLLRAAIDLIQAQAERIQELENLVSDNP